MNAPLSSLPASERAWQWWLAAWALFLKKPRQFLFFGFFYLAFLFLVFFLALKGERLFALIFSSFGQPFFVALLFRYIRVVDKPEERRRLPSRLSAGQKKSWLWWILWRLRFHFPPLWRIFWHLHSDCRLSLAQARVLVRIGIIGFAVSFASAALGDLLQQGVAPPWPQLFVLLISLFWCMAFWCAPLLVVWRHHSAVKSLLFSFLTVWFNWRPILCVLLLLFAVTLGPFFLLPAFPGWLFLLLLCVCCLPVALMMYFCLLYQMYLDFFPFPAHVSEHA